MSRIFNPRKEEDAAVLTVVIRANPDIQLELSFDYGHTWQDRVANINSDGSFRVFDHYFLYRVKG